MNPELNENFITKQVLDREVGIFNALNFTCELTTDIITLTEESSSFPIDEDFN